MRVEVIAGNSATDDRRASSQVHENLTAGNLAELLHALALEYKTADYFPNRRVVIVIDQDAPEDPRSTEIDRLRKALIASGVKEGLVDAIQKGNE